MSKIKVKNLPRLKLEDLLRRRKTTLAKHMKEFGITTYEGLLERCSRMGVEPPSQQQFLSVAPTVVNNPQEGVVVLEAPPVIEEASGKKVSEETISLLLDTAQVNFELETVDCIKKKTKRKKDAQVGDVNE